MWCSLVVVLIAAINFRDLWSTVQQLSLIHILVLFSGVRKRLEDAQPPKCFEGLPITLVAASVTSLSFMGFGGVIENIFAGH